jgi:hypothetical protein
MVCDTLVGFLALRLARETGPGGRERGPLCQPLTIRLRALRASRPV